MPCYSDAAFGNVEGKDPGRTRIEASSVNLAAVDGKVGGPYRHIACRAGAERPGGDQAVSKRHVAIHHDGHARGVPDAGGASLHQASVLNHQGARAKVERASASSGGVDPGSVGDPNGPARRRSRRDIRNGNGDCRLDAGEINSPARGQKEAGVATTYLDVTAHQRKGIARLDLQHAPVDRESTRRRPQKRPCSVSRGSVAAGANGGRLTRPEPRPIRPTADGP
jgi:hypothetical protein